MKTLKILFVFVMLIAAALAWHFAQKLNQASPVQQARKQLQVPTTQNITDGIGVVILIDASGSMADNVLDATGKPTPKIAIARRCVEKSVKQIIGFKKELPDRPLYFNLTAFSAHNNGTPFTRSIITLEKGVPEFLKEITPDGGTPIGAALIEAANHLTRDAKLNRSHILVVTDGENTVGLKPDPVLEALNQFPEEARPHVYFIAFDVSASVFQPLTRQGAIILPASDESQLQSSLDMLIGEKILLEK